MKSRHRIVVGLGFGDEGKGATVSSLINDSVNPLVIRFNGGHQAGHTVVHNGIRHVFSNFGAGTLQGVPTYWSKYCTFDPAAVLKEYEILRDKGVTPKLFVHPECPVVTCYDIKANSLRQGNGTCGVGFGITLQREEDLYSLKVKDLLFPTVFKAKFKSIRDYHILQHNVESYTTSEKIILAEFEATVKKVLDIITIDPAPSWATDYIYEGAQGILLDQHHGFFPNVTRSNTTSKNALQMLSITLSDLYANPEVIFVTRTYQTRHGNGFMSSESPPQLVNNENETNVENFYQGKFRTGLLDIELLHYALKCDPSGADASVRFTCLDQIGDGKGGSIPVIDYGRIKFMTVDEIYDRLKEVRRLTLRV